MVAPKKRGRPQEAEERLEVGLLLDDANADFLDSFDPDGPQVRQAKPVAEPPRAPESRPEAEPEPRLSVVEDKPEESAPPRARTARGKPGPKPADRSRKKQKPRPPRIDVGFREELEEAATKLWRDGVSNSREPSLNRTDVIAAATAAVARASGSVSYSRVQPRGHYRSPTAKALHDELEEAYVMALGEYYIDRYRDRLSDRALRLCYELYKQRMTPDEDDGIPRVAD